ncbi:PQQ-binding-like beta-propeller repeat protein [Gimesia aquarii]|uniref:Outer membrane protein assembly factor BamB n=1 Tax=Gimesia aquarii TaxID=2527964 RepID=A0A517WZ91_9PLAN|nr:PQQ-binding-like beta-propeller repeat protein [Gimesia aquarii]QDU10571.1 Outer membrane protein assembly factor BamB [Gimesia aquarii]
MKDTGNSRRYMKCLSALIFTSCVLLITPLPTPQNGTQDSSINAQSIAVKPDDWPYFLGPLQTGISAETNLIDEFPEEGPALLWEKKIGTGYSAPSILGNQLIIHHRPDANRKSKEVIECLTADTGKLLWKYEYDSDFRDPYGYNNGPRCSPLLTPKYCYTFGAQGKLYCLNLKDGKLVWHRDCLKEFDVPPGFFGVGSTPILEGNQLIVMVGGKPNSGMVSFDALTGKTLWENVGKKVWDGTSTGWERMPVYQWRGANIKLSSYSSPLAVTIHGKRHLLCLMRQGLVSLDPKDGSVNFKYWFRSMINDSVNAARPVVVDDKIFLSAAYEVGSALLQVNPEGKSYKELWRNPTNMMTHWSTTIHHKGYLYGFSGRHERGATMRCVRLSDGKVMWETDGTAPVIGKVKRNQLTGQFQWINSGKPAPWPFYGRGSAVLADNKFIVLGERGTLAIVKVDPDQFHEVCRTSFPQIKYPSWTAPVLAHKKLYLRSESHVLCLDFDKNSQKDK